MNCPICKNELPELSNPDHYDKNQWMFSTDCTVCGSAVTVTVSFIGEADKK